MARPADRGETATRRTIEVREHAVRATEPRAQSHEGYARGQLPENQNRHREQYQTNQPAVGPGEEGKGEGLEGGKVELLEGRGGVPETERSQTGFLHGC